jgi:FMN-binding domain
MSWIDRCTPGWIGALGVLAAGAPVQVVVATEYMSLEGAQKALFPQADRFNEVVLSLSPAQRDRVAALAGAQPPHRSLRAWRALHGDEALGFVFVDEVIGKEDFITYALGIDASGRLSAPEVLAYRESHGGEIRNPAWRRQFAGREGLDQLRVQTDIKNIAGATLSCQHVTEGVRWLTALWQVALQPAPSTAG